MSRPHVRTEGMLEGWYFDDSPLHLGLSWHHWLGPKFHSSPVSTSAEGSSRGRGTPAACFSCLVLFPPFPPSAPPSIIEIEAVVLSVLVGKRVGCGVSAPEDSGGETGFRVWD